MKTSRYYQNWLQIVSRGSTVFLFFSAYFLGREAFMIAFTLLSVQLGAGFAISELLYKRMKAVVKECKEDKL